MSKNVFFLLFSMLTVPAFCQKSTAVNVEAIPTNTILVSPASLSFNLDRGGSRTQLVTVKNTTTRTYQFNTLLMDWNRDTLGEHVFQDPGTLEQSCAKWVSFDKSFLELGPGEGTTVAVTLKVPDDPNAITEMRWTMLLFKTVSEKVVPNTSTKLSLASVQSTAIGVHVYQTPPNITNKELKMLSFNEMATPGTYRITCKNLGGVQLACKFSLELTSEQTGAKTSLTSKIIPLFPKQDRYVDFTVPDSLPKGKYTIVAMIDADDDSVPIEAVQKEVLLK